MHGMANGSDVLEDIPGGRDCPRRQTVGRLRVDRRSPPPAQCLTAAPSSPRAYFLSPLVHPRSPSWGPPSLRPSRTKRCSPPTPPSMYVVSRTRSSVHPSHPTLVLGRCREPARGPPSLDRHPPRAAARSRRTHSFPYSVRALASPARGATCARGD